MRSFFFFQLVHVLENDELSLYVNSPAEVRDDMRYVHFHFNTVFTSTGEYT